MKIKVIDLYREYGLNKTENLDGTLVCVLRESAIDKGEQFPAMLVVAGGGYEHVSSREREPVAVQYFAQGYNCFILQYSVNVLYPTALIEASLAMDYIRKNHTELNVDNDCVYAVGFSAGAHLSGTLAYNYDEPIFLSELKKILPNSYKDVTKNMKPDALVLSYPVVTADERWSHHGSINQLSHGDNRLIEALSLEKRIKSDSPSTFIWHTSDDKSVPVFNSIMLANALAQKNVPFALHIFAHGEHGLSVANAQAYKNGIKPDFSTGLEGWVKLSLDFLSDEKSKIKR